MIAIGGILFLGKDLQGEASLEARASHFLEIEEEQGLCLMREITSHLHSSRGLVADLGQRKGSRRLVCTFVWIVCNNGLEVKGFHLNFAFASLPACVCW